MRWTIVVTLVVCLAGASGRAFGQALQSRDAARMLVTVLDTSGAILPGAAVTVAPSSGSGAALTADADPSGVATVAMPAGRYSVRAGFPGFDATELRDVRVRAGDNKVRVVLRVQGVSETVTVGQDKQAAALDPLGNAFSTVLTREQIAALPDDPDEMEEVLKAMAPPGASIRVDGFTGGKLPPKSQIKSIRLPRLDMYAAQNHGGLMGALFIDITTQPGLGPLRGSMDAAYRDTALSARNPFTPAKSDEGLHQYGASFSGTIVPGKSSFSITAQRARQFDSATLLAATTAGSVSQAIARPSRRFNLNGSLLTAAGHDHTMRFVFQQNSADSDNLGVGGFNLFDRAYSTTSADSFIRVSDSGPIGRRGFSESRLQVRWLDASQHAGLEAPAIVVLDAFTAGGAQVKGGRNAVEIEAATDLDYVRGRHSLRTGVQLEGGRYHSSQAANYLGTFTFTSLSEYQAHHPASYTRQAGDPDVRYGNLQAGAYLQDDWRVSRGLLLSAGVRVEAQTLIADQNNISPRVTATYAPFRSGKTTWRAGFGYFTDWLGLQTYEQSRQLDGLHQRQINIRNPAYPDPEAGAASLPADRYLIDSDAVLPASAGGYVGMDQALSSVLRANVSYSYRRGVNLLRGRNLNPPIDGIRGDAAFANIVETTSDARSRTHSLNAGATLTALNWHRTVLAANYTFAKSESNSGGAFWLAATGDLDHEWGVTAPRHQWSAMFSTQPMKNLSVGMTARGRSGMPYNVTTGFDDNGDGVFNDRPRGLARNSAWTAASWDLGVRVTYGRSFGPRVGASGGGVNVVVRSAGDSMPGDGPGGADDRRYRIEVYLAAQNVTDHDNFTGYSGVMTSPFFGQPTNVLNPRKAEVGIRIGF